MSQVPPQESIGELTVSHPRYALLPKVSMMWHGLSMYFGALAVATRLHHEIRFDCIDAHYVYPDGLAAVLIGRRLGIPVAVSARGTDVNLFPSFLLIRPQIRWTLERAAGVIAVSGALRDSMVRLGIPPEKIRVIGNGVDPQRFGPVGQREARLRLGLPIDGQLVVSVGGLIPRKCHRRLISAIAEIAPRHPDLRLYIIGEGSLRRELLELIRDLEMGSRVFLVGSVPNDQLKYWYSAAEMSCLVSSREGWANVLLESMACGTAVLATRVWGAAEVIKSPDFGVLVEPDVPGIARGLELALAKRWDRDGILRYGRSRTWDVVAEEAETFLTSQVLADERLGPQVSYASGQSPANQAERR